MAAAWYSGENYDPDPNLKIWFDGKIIPVADAKVSIFDHALLYGDGVFEGIRSYNGRIFECTAHLKRFFASAKGIDLALPWTMEQLEKGLEDALEANGLKKPDKDAYFRLVATRGVGKLGISPRRTWKPTVFAIASTISMYPPEVYTDGMSIIVCSFVRNHGNAMPPQIKSLNYLNNILGKIEAHEANVPEAIMMNHLGNVAEATGDNVFIIRNGQIQTPPVSAGILEGITRNTIIRLAREHGYEAVERDLCRMELYSADEVFLTGTGAQVVPVISIDKRQIGNGKPGPITRFLMDTYEKLVRGIPTEKSAAERGATARV